jgi:hypothetical protein
MRDPRRIDHVIETVRRVWHLVPDWRLGQLLCNLSRDCGSWDSFFTGDDVMEAAALNWLAKTPERSGPTVVITEQYSNVQDAVEAAEVKCPYGFEIRSKPAGGCELIYVIDDEEGGAQQ